jgi:hypothetical protein
VGAVTPAAQIDPAGHTVGENAARAQNDLNKNKIKTRSSLETKKNLKLTPLGRSCTDCHIDRLRTHTWKHELASMKFTNEGERKTGHESRQPDTYQIQSPCLRGAGTQLQRPSCLGRRKSQTGGIGKNLARRS